MLLGVNLNSQDTLLNYIGGLHSYLKHIIFMFNPNNLDEVCVQATHLESRGNNIQKEVSKRKPFKGTKKEKSEKWKGKKNASVKKEGEKTICQHCSKAGHYETHYWKLHPKLRPKKQNNKGKQNTMLPHNMTLDHILVMRPRFQPWLQKENKLLQALVHHIVKTPLQIKSQE